MLSDGAWVGSHCFVVAGGPSLSSFNWRLLDGETRIICVNFAYEKLPQAACVITEDVRFIQLAARREDWRSFRGEKILSCLEPSYEPLARAAEPKIRIVPRKRPDKFWARSISEGLSYSSCSLVPAMNLADILGADPIYLLGVDLNPLGYTAQTNYHDHYVRAGFERTGDDQLNSFRSDLTYWVAPHMQLKRILNLNPKSALDCWKRQSPEEALGGTCESRRLVSTLRPINERLLGS